MKKHVTIIILLFLTQCAVTAQVNDPLLNKLRSSRIRNGNKITLQSNIKKLRGVTIKSVCDHYYLKKGTFGGADSIDIEVNKKNKITVVSFFYDSVSSYEYEVNLFNKHLNLIGKESQFISKNNAMKVTKWEDQQYVFEMVETTANNKPQLYSVLFDKEFYFKKTKHYVDLTKNENSIEILKRFLGI